MANEFQARYLEILKGSPYIQSVAKPGRQIVNIEYYSYNTRIGTVAAPLLNGVAQTSTIETQADSDFVIAYTSFCSQDIDNASLSFNQTFLLQMQDQSSGKFFYNVPVLSSLVAGGGGFPFVNPAPRVLNPNTNLLVSVTNQNPNINPVGAFIALHGQRIYYA